MPPARVRFWSCFLMFLNNVGGAEYPGTETRPTLSQAEADAVSPSGYLGSWIPEQFSNPDTSKYMVGKNQLYSSIQQAVNQAILDNAGIGSTGTRQFIIVNGGVYQETLFIPTGLVPLTIYGVNGPKIVLNQGADMTVAAWMAQVNPNGTRYKETDPAYSLFYSCAKKSPTDNIGTRCTSVVWIKRSNTQMFNITIENSATAAQAVALRADGDKLQLDQVRLLGYQDTFYVGSGHVFVNNSHLQGDTDYVCGEGTAIFTNCIFKTVAVRKNRGVIFAPKTSCNDSFGFLVMSSVFTGAQELLGASNVILGRPWDSPEYVPGQSPNGQLLIRNSWIDWMINMSAPWGEGIASQRAFLGNVGEGRDLNDPGFNRFWEFQNDGAV